MKIFVPTYYAKSIFDINPMFFKENNIKLILSDLDNTLDSHDLLNPSPRVVELKSKFDELGIKLCIVSNNKGKRKGIYCERLGVEGIFSCYKPFPNKILKFIEKLGYKKDEVILIGDQLLTDVFCGNNAGIKVILTDPIVKKDQWTTRFNRLLDRPLRNRLRKKGVLEGVRIDYEK